MFIGVSALHSSITAFGLIEECLRGNKCFGFTFTLLLASQLTAASVPLRDCFNQQVAEPLWLQAVLCGRGKGSEKERPSKQPLWTRRPSRTLAPDSQRAVCHQVTLPKPESRIRCMMGNLHICEGGTGSTGSGAAQTAKHSRSDSRKDPVRQTTSCPD